MYLINFVLCSGLLLIVYRLFLQNERMYRFSRFYLLFSLVFSLAVPFITISTKTEAIPVVYQQVVYQAFDNGTDQHIIAPANVQAPKFEIGNYLPAILTGLYGLVALILLVRFVINLYRIRKEIAESEQINHQHTRLILTSADVTPHSFLNYVFINRNDYRDGAVEPEIICHEQTHVKQWHSLDVILVELFQALCWFNPFIPFYRKAIKLNHEFLADEAVIESYADTPAYQYLLLAKASQARSVQLASQFNYLTTKKRLIMMTKTTSAKMAWGKKLALLPVLAVTLFFFSNKTLAQQKSKLEEVRIDEPVKEVRKDKSKVEEVRIDEPLQEIRIDEPVPNPKELVKAYNAILNKYNYPTGVATLKAGKFAPVERKLFDVPQFSAADKAKLISLYNLMSQKQRDEQILGFIKNSPPFAKVTPTEQQYNNFKNPKEYGVWIDGKKVSNKTLDEYKASDFDHFFVSRLSANAIHHNEYNNQLDLMTKAYYADYYQKEKAKENEYHPMVHITKELAAKYKIDQVRFPTPKVDQVKFPKPKADTVVEVK